MCDTKYLLDINLSDSEARIMTILRSLAPKDTPNRIQISNRDLATMINKSSNAMAKIIFNCAKKGYLQSVIFARDRILYIKK